MKSAGHVGFISHKGKQVLLLDFSNCTPEEVKSVSDEARRIITAQPQNSVLVLADFTGAQFSPDAVTRIKEVTTYDRPYVKRARGCTRRACPRSSTTPSRHFRSASSRYSRHARRRWSSWWKIRVGCPRKESVRQRTERPAEVVRPQDGENAPPKSQVQESRSDGRRNRRHVRRNYS